MTNPNFTSVRLALTHTVFGAMGDDALEKICSFARIEIFQIPTLLSAAKQHPNYLRLVLSGYIEVTARNAAGSEYVVGQIPPGGWATWLACFMEEPPYTDFYSSVDAQYLAIPTPVVRAFCEEHPEIYPSIIRLIGRRTRLLIEWTGQSVLAEPAQRFARLLHIMARDRSNGENQAVIKISQQKLANMAQCSRQTANELANQLKRQGLVDVKYNQIQILDINRLLRFSEHQD